MTMSYGTPLGGVTSNSVNTGQIIRDRYGNQLTPEQYAAMVAGQSGPYGGPNQQRTQSVTPASAPSPVTPLTSQAGPMTAQNLPDWASTTGSRAASLADPFAEQRPQYQTQLADLMKNPGEFASSPVYKFAFDQGLEAVNRTAGAKGQLGSGNRLIDLTKFGQGLAGQQFYQMAPLLGRFAGADTSSPASAGMAYAYGQGKALDAFSNQEMEKAYRDALAQQTTGGNRGPSLPQVPQGMDPLSQQRWDQYNAQQQPQQQPQQMAGPSQGQSGGLYPGGFGVSEQDALGYGEGDIVGPGAGGLYPGGFGISEQDALGYGEGDPLTQLNYNPALDTGLGGAYATEGGAMDMGTGGNLWQQPIPTLQKINSTIYPNNYQDTLGDWSFMGVRG